MQGVYHLSNLLSGTHGLLGQILHLYMGLITSCLLFPFFLRQMFQFARFQG